MQMLSREPCPEEVYDFIEPQEQTHNKEKKQLEV